MSPLKGLGAVTAACFTSGLAGVYFEMVPKGSKADLWVIAGTVVVHDQILGVGRCSVVEGLGQMMGRVGETGFAVVYSRMYFKAQ